MHAILKGSKWGKWQKALELCLCFQITLNFWPHLLESTRAKIVAWPGSTLLKPEPSSLSANSWLLLPRDSGLLQQENMCQCLGLIRCDDKTSHGADRTDREEQTLGRLIAARFYCMVDKRRKNIFLY